MTKHVTNVTEGVCDVYAEYNGKVVNLEPEEKEMFLQITQEMREKKMKDEMKDLYRASVKKKKKDDEQKDKKKDDELGYGLFD